MKAWMLVTAVGLVLGLMAVSAVASYMQQVYSQLP